MSEARTRFLKDQGIMLSICKEYKKRYITPKCMDLVCDLDDCWFGISCTVDNCGEEYKAKLKLELDNMIDLVILDPSNGWLFIDVMGYITMVMNELYFSPLLSDDSELRVKLVDDFASGCIKKIEWSEDSLYGDLRCYFLYVMYFYMVLNSPDVDWFSDYDVVEEHGFLFHEIFDITHIEFDKLSKETQMKYDLARRYFAGAKVCINEFILKYEEGTI